MEKTVLSWKEKMAGWVVFLVGMGYLLLQVLNIISSKSNSISVTSDSLVISKSELVSDIKTYFYILCGLTGGFLLLRGKVTGWIISVPYLVVFTVLSSWGILFSINMHTYGSMLFLLFVWILFALSLYFLLRREGLKKLRVSKTAVLLTLVFLFSMIVLLFIL